MEKVVHAYENVIARAASARGDLASLTITAGRESGWRSAARWSDDVLGMVNDGEDPKV
jgi:hypothetical protein